MRRWEQSARPSSSIQVDDDDDMDRAMEESKMRKYMERADKAAEEALRVVRGEHAGPKEAEASCAICGQPIEKRRFAKTLSCGHCFHFACIDGHHQAELRAKKSVTITCFTCRAPVGGPTIAEVAEEKRKEREARKPADMEAARAEIKAAEEAEKSESPAEETSATPAREECLALAIREPTEDDISPSSPSSSAPPAGEPGGGAAAVAAVRADDAVRGARGPQPETAATGVSSSAWKARADAVRANRRSGAGGRSTLSKLAKATAAEGK